MAPALTRTTIAEQSTGGGCGQMGPGMMSNQTVQFPPVASETFSQLFESPHTMPLKEAWVGSGMALCTSIAAGHQGPAGISHLFLLNWSVIGCHIPKEFFQM